MPGGVSLKPNCAVLDLDRRPNCHFLRLFDFVWYIFDPPHPVQFLSHRSSRNFKELLVYVTLGAVDPPYRSTLTRTFCCQLMIESGCGQGHPLQNNRFPVKVIYYTNYEKRHVFRHHSLIIDAQRCF